MADTSFFGRLTRLFSTQAIVRVDSKGRRKVVDTDDRQRTNLSSLRDRYTKLQKAQYEIKTRKNDKTHNLWRLTYVKNMWHTISAFFRKRLCRRIYR